MTDADHAKQFAALDPRTFVRLGGFGNGLTDWHVNNNLKITAGDDALDAMLSRFTDNDDLSPDAHTTHGIVLQRADRSEEWLAVIVKRDDDGNWSVAHQHYLDSPRTDPEPVESELRVRAVADTKINLGDPESS